MWSDIPFRKVILVPVKQQTEEGPRVDAEDRGSDVVMQLGNDGRLD